MAVAPSQASLRDLFRQRNFVLFQVANFVVVANLLMMSVAVGWQVYHISGKPLSLGLVGLAQFLPLLCFSLVTGQIIDRLERKRILMVCYVCQIGLALSLFFLSRSGSSDLWKIYVLMALVGTVRAFEDPSSSSMIPFLVPKELLPRAVAFGSSVFMMAVISGPALGGLVLSLPGGQETVYLVGACGVSLSALAVTQLTCKTSGGGKDPVNWQNAVAGLKFVFSQKLLLGAISLDLMAVLLGGTVALLPIFAKDILEVGPKGLGALRAAPAVGAGVMAALLMVRPIHHGAGKRLFAAVMVFGLATIGFGVSKVFLLSLVMLILLGAADMVSVVVRHTLVQTRTPSALLGRVATVNMVFIGASNELGEFESGVMAHWFGTVPAVLIGGVGTVVVCVVWWFLFRELAEVDRLQEPLSVEGG